WSSGRRPPSRGSCGGRAARRRGEIRLSMQARPEESGCRRRGGVGVTSVDGDGGDGEAEDLLEGADVLLGAAVTGGRAGVHRGRVEQTCGEAAQRAGGVV